MKVSVRTLIGEELIDIDTDVWVLSSPDGIWHGEKLIPYNKISYVVYDGSDYTLLDRLHKHQIPVYKERKYDVTIKTETGVVVIPEYGWFSRKELKKHISDFNTIVGITYDGFDDEVFNLAHWYGIPVVGTTGKKRNFIDEGHKRW